MSDSQSFGSNYHPSSQSRKISIGVMLDSIAKRKPGTIMEDKGKQPNTERIKLITGISAEGKNKGEAVTTSKGKQAEDTEQVKSPWITPRSVHKGSLAPETASFLEETSNLGQKKHKTAKDVLVTYSVQFFSNQTLNAQNVGSKQNSFDGFIDGLTYKRNECMDGNSQRVEEFNFANEGKVIESDKLVLEGKADKTQKIQTETLKMKLQELLGTVSSPKSPLSSSQAYEVHPKNLKPKISADHMGNTVVKPRENSDTIESDSDDPDQTIKGPVTHSFTRKRAPAKVQADKIKVVLSSKQKHQESIFCFGEGRSTKLDVAVNNGSKLSRKKKIQKNSKLDPPKISFPEEDNADQIKQTTYRSETIVPAGKTSMLGNKMDSFPGSFSEKRSDCFEMVQEKHSFRSPVRNKKNQLVTFDNPMPAEIGDKQEDFGNIPLRNVAYTADNFQSPTFGFKTPILNTSPSPTPKTVEIEQGACSPVPSERRFIIGNIPSFRTFQTSRPVCNKSNEQAHSPEDEEKYPDSSLRNQMPSKETIDAVHERSEPSPEETSESSETGARIGESFWFQELSEQDQEDELTRAVTLFALALETFKRKMDSTTRKRSSEILVSISEEIKSLLLNAESQIESDLGKLTSLGKTKRKHLEIKLQEQQEQLKVILQKFKEDIHHHLLDCNSILEGLGTHQIELKGIIKKQKASHQKLLMRVEEAAEIQLNNAERRITAVQELAREKTLELKHVISECLKDSIY